MKPNFKFASKFEFFLFLLFGIVYFLSLVVFDELKTYHIYIIAFFISIFLLNTVYKIYSKRKNKQDLHQQKKDIETFKKKSKRIKVDLENVEIKSNSWSVLKQIDNTKYADLNEVLGDGYSNYEQADINSNIVTVDIPYKGDIMKYRFTTDKDLTSLRIHFALKKETYFYINPYDYGDFYLDLEFLYNE